MISKLATCTAFFLVAGSQAFADENLLPDGVYTWQDLGQTGFDSETLGNIDRFTDDYTSIFDYLLNNPDAAKETTVSKKKQWKNVSETVVYKTTDDGTTYALTPDQLEYMRDAIELKSKAYDTLIQNGIVPSEAFGSGQFNQDGFIGSINSGVPLGN